LTGRKKGIFSPQVSRSTSPLYVTFVQRNTLWMTNSIVWAHFGSLSFDTFVTAGDRMPETLLAPMPPSTESGASGKSDAPIRADWRRALLLAAAVVASNAWLIRHLGWGLENPFGIGSLAAGVGLVSLLAENLLREGERKAFHMSLSQIPLSIVFLFLGAFVILALVRSSIIVISDSHGNELPWEGVHVDRGDSGQAIAPLGRKEKDEPMRFFLPTSPFGRLYRVKVPGYIEQVVDVYPFLGRTVVPERDLRVSPAVLFRPPTVALQELQPKSGGQFQVRLLEGSSFRILKVACRRSSYLVGSEREIPAAWMAIWDLELKGSQVSDSAGDASSSKLAWFRHTVLEPGRDLAPGDVLEARVVSSGRGIVASVRTKLGNEPLRDVPLVAETSSRTVPAEEVLPCPNE